MEYGYIDAVLAEKLDSCKPILFKLFPNSEIEILLRELENEYHNDYILSIHDQKKNRLGYLEVSLIWRENPSLISIALHEDFSDNRNIHSLQLYRDFTYQVEFSGKGFSWFREGKYKKPENYQEIEAVLKEIWDILA